MADTKISALPSASTPLTGAEVLPIVQGAANFKVSVADLTTGRAVSVASLTASGASVISVTDNTNAALRITQLGTGNALLVEDEANPDASPFVITNNGAVIAGYTSRVTSVNVIEAHSAANINSTPAIGVYSWGTLASGGGLNLYKSRSGTVGTYSLVANGTQSSVRFQFDDGAAFQQAASIIGSAEGTPALNSMPGRLTFGTTAAGSVTPTERMRIDSTGATTFTGNVGMGASVPAVKLEIAGNNNTLWTVTASISGVTMDVTVITGTIAVGDLVFGAGVQPYTRVTAFGTGTGGVGTYTVSVFQTVTSATISGTTQYGATLIRITDIDTSQAAGQPNGALQFFTSDASTPTAGVSAYVAALAESVTPDTSLVFGTRDNAGGGVDANERMRLDSSGNLGIGTNLPGAKLDVNGGALIQGLTVGRGAGAVNTNTAVGASALASNTTGASNVMVGRLAGASNTSGSDNTFVGQFSGNANTTGSSNSFFNAAGYSNTSGANNTGLGYQALASNTTASNNTAVGYQAAYSNVIGEYVTALGFQAGYSNTADKNLFVGSRAGYFNTTGTNNAFVGNQNTYGYSAGYSNTTGSENVAVGSAALANNTTASYNTAVGYQAAYSNTTGAENTFVGVTAGYANTTGQKNSGLGKDALVNNTTGSFNVAVGQGALILNTTASNNTAVGYQAGYSNTTGASNVAVGTYSLYTNITGSQSVAIGLYSQFAATAGGSTSTGAYSLRNMTTGSGNAAFGDYAGYSSTTGANNTIVGSQALYSNTTASSNTAVGYQAAYSNTIGTRNVAVGLFARNTPAIGDCNIAIGAYATQGTGSYNVGVGDIALASQTTGSNNTAIGREALYFNTTASNNTAVGYKAGYANTTGVDNVALGYTAGSTQTTAKANCFIGTAAGGGVTTGSYNTFIGSGEIGITGGAGEFVTTGSKNTILGRFSGNQGGLDIRTASNFIVLSDGDGNPRIVNNGTVTATPAIALSANSNANTGSFAQIRSADGAISSTDARLLLGNSNGAYANLRIVANSTTELAMDSVAGNNTSAPLNMLLNVNGGKIGMGVSSIDASGGVLQLASGITFPATQSASSNANTLDDYERGNWTPTFTFGGSSTGVTYGAQSGKYIKIGNQVTVWIYLTLSSKGSSTGNAGIAGLPFANGNGPGFEGATFAVNYWNALASTVIPLGYVQSNNPSILLVNGAPSTVTPVLTDGTFTNTSTVFGIATYTVA